MHKDRLLFWTFLLAILSSVLFFLANFFYFYWYYWWFDVLMHFLVAFTGGLGLYWGFYYSGLVFRSKSSNRLINIAWVFGAVLLWALAWELFEYKNGLTQSTEGYYLDTLNDLVLGAMGGLLAAILSSRHG